MAGCMEVGHEPEGSGAVHELRCTSPARLDEYVDGLSLSVFRAVGLEDCRQGNRERTKRVVRARRDWKTGEHGLQCVEWIMRPVGGPKERRSSRPGHPHGDGAARFRRAARCRS